jgi:transcriptional regulator with XRE-family HTH domain
VRSLPAPIARSSLIAAANVRRLRLLAGMTQADLARKAFCSRPLIAQVETAKRNPALPLLDDLAGALGTETSVLLTDPERVPCWQCADERKPGWLCLGCLVRAA